MRLGEYDILHRLRAGGMAEVFLAVRTGPAGFRRRVVLKRALGHLALDPAYETMLLEEARLTAAIHHPAVVEVLDAGSGPEAAYYVMEYLDGLDLLRIQRLLSSRGERMPLSHVLLIGATVAAGLHAAHEARDLNGEPLAVVHRDVSPDNVIVTFEGEIKLIDFGVAHTATRRAGTAPGVTKGKLAFMSPEQIEGRDVDRRSDLFSLGLLLHELSTGVRLWRDLSEAAILLQITDGRIPPPSQCCPDYPPGLERILMRALAGARARRQPTAAVFGAELDALARHLGETGNPLELGRWLRALAHGEEPAQPSAWPSLETSQPAGSDDPYYESIDMSFFQAERAPCLPPPPRRRQATRRLLAAPPRPARRAGTVRGVDSRPQLRKRRT